MQVVAQLNYLSPLREKPVAYLCEPPPGTPRENHRYEARAVSITDARPAASSFELDRDGFALLRHRTGARDLGADDEVRRAYYPEAAELIREATGATRVLVFDHAIRRRHPTRPQLSFGRDHATLQPVGRVHCDYTETSAPRRLAELLGEGFASLGDRRYCEVNLWRSLRHPVLDVPLAVCASWSAAPEDLVACEARYATRRGELYLATYSSKHRWFYFSAMAADDVLIFKGYDSRKTGARFTLHSAFEHPGARDDAPLRQSVELRAFALF